MVVDIDINMRFTPPYIPQPVQNDSMDSRARHPARVRNSPPPLTAAKRIHSQPGALICLGILGVGRPEKPWLGDRWSVDRWVTIHSDFVSSEESAFYTLVPGPARYADLKGAGNCRACQGPSHLFRAEP